jgi:hypothetical protein
MKRVLHVPDDWRTRWGPAIDAVKADAKFNKHHEKYCGLCEKRGHAREELLPSLDGDGKRCSRRRVSVQIRGHPFGKASVLPRQRPNHLKGGVMNKKGLSPDLVLLHKGPPCPGRKQHGSLGEPSPRPRSQTIRQRAMRRKEYAQIGCRR